MIALADPLEHGLGRRYIEGDRQLARRTPSPHGEAGVLEHPQHRPIGGHHLSIEAVDPAVRRDLRELLEHPHPDTTALIMIGDRKRDLGDARLAQPVIAGDRHHASVVPADQRQAINAGGLRVRARDGVGAAEAVEAKIAALRREVVVERLDVVEVDRRRGLQPQRRPIAKQNVPDQRLGIGRSDGHMPPRRPQAGRANISVSATQTGLSPPSRSKVSSEVTMTPPDTSSTAPRRRCMRTRSPTGSAAGKRNLLRP